MSTQTKNYGRISQRISANSVETLIGDEVVCSAANLSRREKREQLDYQYEYASQLIEDREKFETGLKSGKYGY